MPACRTVRPPGRPDRLRPRTPGLALALAGLVSLLLAAPAGAQETGDAEEDEPPSIRILTRSSELIVGTIALESVGIRTRYGRLEVPIDEVKTIDLVTRPTPEDVERVRRLVQRAREAVETSDADDDAAGVEPLRDALYRAARRVPGVIRSERSRTSGEVRKLLEGVLEEIEQLPRAQAATEDVLHAERFTIRGEVDLARLPVASEYGELLVSREDIDRLAVGDANWRPRADKLLIVKTWTDADGEFKNTRDILDERTGLKLVDFSGDSASELERALRRHAVLVVPELEQGGNASQVASQASGALRRFVRSGGVLVSCGGSNNFGFLSQSKVLPCQSGAGDKDASVRRRHPILRGVSGTIPEANATFPLRSTGKPSMKALATSGSGDIIVGVARYGDGAIVWCGWDYFDSEESHQRVLANAVRWAAGAGEGIRGF